MKFAQMISLRSDDPTALAEHLAAWDRLQAGSDVMGYIGTRLLADRDDPGHYVILAEFAEVDGDLTAAEEAELNNRREETDRWARELREMADGEPDWIHYDELYRTGITGDLRTG